MTSGHHSCQVSRKVRGDAEAARVSVAQRVVCVHACTGIGQNAQVTFERSAEEETCATPVKRSCVTNAQCSLQAISATTLLCVADQTS